VSVVTKKQHLIKLMQVLGYRLGALLNNICFRGSIIRIVNTALVA